MQFFDPTQEYAIVERRLPHWSQAGVVTFITWRTWDSMPEHVVRQWRQERDDWLKRNGIDPKRADLNWFLTTVDPRMVQKLQHFLAARWNEQLDQCHGACVLERPEISKEIRNSLLHFDGDRYEITDFAIMPNHVHLLATFPNEAAMLKQCESWKHSTSTQINRLLGRKGRFWQQDAFDHLVRSQEQFGYLRKYIAENPSKAKLSVGRYRLYSSRSA